MLHRDVEVQSFQHTVCCKIYVKDYGSQIAV